MVVFEVLGSLGLGEQVMTAAVLAIAGWYLLRGKSAFATVATALGTVTTIALGVLAVLVVAIGLGWFDPQPDVFISHVSSAISGLVQLAGDAVVDWLTGVLP